MSRQQFDEAMALHTGRSASFIAETLAQAIFEKGLWDLDPDNQAWLIIMAGTAYKAMTDQGVDFMFGEDGSFLYVVT